MRVYPSPSQDEDEGVPESESRLTSDSGLPTLVLGLPDIVSDLPVLDSVLLLS